MNKTFWEIWDNAQHDLQYSLLLQQLRVLDREYEKALLLLPDEQKETVCEYVALCEAMSEQMLEIACERMEHE